MVPEGIITKEQTGGLELKWVTPITMLKVLDLIVKNEGPLGRVLVTGLRRAAKIWGNGAENALPPSRVPNLAAHMPQAQRSLSLIYAVNPFGADHQSSEHDPTTKKVSAIQSRRLKQIAWFPATRCTA